MRVILINPAYFALRESEIRRQKFIDAIKGGNMYFYPFEPPIGLASLSACLSRGGHDVELIDIPGEKINESGLRKRLSESTPDLVGITAMTPTIQNALDIAGISKSIIPSVPVILGGVHPTVLPESVLSNENVDFVMRGEGEIALSQFLEQGLDRPQKIEGLCWKNSDGLLNITEKAPPIANLESIPPPDYNAFPADRYIEYTKSLRGIRALSMMVTRGCPYHCAFCAVRETMGNMWRHLAPGYSADLMLKRCIDFDLEGIWFKDSIFNMRKDWVETFAKKLISCKSPYHFQINTRVDLINAEQIALLKKAGLCQIDLGIESGSQKSLETLKKGTTIDQIRSNVRIIQNSGIKVSGFFMIGIPGETEDEINQTFQLSRELKLDRASVSIFTPLPGSELYDKLLSAGKCACNAESFEYNHFTETRDSFCEVSIHRLKELYSKINSYFGSVAKNI